MRRSPLLPLVLVVLLGACTQGQKPAETDRAPKTGVKADAKADAKADVKADAKAATPEKTPDGAVAPRFWVAQDGLKAYDLDGAQVATRGDWGDYARRLPDGRVILLRDRDERVELKLLAAGEDAAPTVAVPSALDPKTCRAVAPSDGDDGAEQLALSVQDPADVTLGAGVLCLTLMDRNANMADYVMRVSYTPSSKAFASSVEIDVEETCEPSPLPACKDAKAGAPWIEHAPPAAARSDAWPVVYEPKTAQLKRGAEVLGQLCPAGAADDPEFEIEYGCAELESSSPSGRYQLLAGARESGDYIYRNLLVLDREEGVILSPPGEDPGPDGKRGMIEVAPAAVMDEEQAPGVMATGETEVVWLPGERLWIGGTLLIPAERRAQHIGGTLARTG